ncbi:MAG TPA: wax ester/triacylglycerol synthase family O-acyltransferase [Usitatibacter sp.]|nr:wax ester/triacylglycerol synthase family O-acyltransferase [Usitatibacter sp.]
MTNRERISGVDTAWLRMDEATNPMMIVGVMMFDGRVKVADVRRLLEARWLGFRRFRQKAVQDAAGAWWEDDPALDMEWHLREVSLPGPAGKAELEALVSELASTPLDSDRPLWQFHLVRNYAGGAALVSRIHHCYADGIALVQVMLSLTSESAQASLALPAEEIGEARGEEADFLAQLLKPISGALGGAAQIGRGLVEQGRGFAANPQQAAGAMQDAARKGVDFATEVARLLTMGRDAQTRFKGQLGGRKRAAWAEPLPLEEVKVVGKALGCSINDVLLSLAAGALRDYLVEKGDEVAGGLEIRAIVPVNLRAPGEGRNLGNQFGLVFLDLPIGIDHPLERLYEVRRRMRALKGSYQPIIALGLLGAVGYGPRMVQEQVTQLLGNSASAVMTNVPGPQQALYFAGRRIVELDFWVPQSGGIGLGVSILSYDGRIQFGVIADDALVPDPDAIVTRFCDEFARLLWITLMSPWGEEAAEESPAKAAPKARAKRSKASAAAQAEASPAVLPKRFRNL